MCRTENFPLTISVSDSYDWVGFLLLGNIEAT